MVACESLGNRETQAVQPLSRRARKDDLGLETLCCTGQYRWRISHFLAVVPCLVFRPESLHEEHPVIAVRLRNLLRKQSQCRRLIPG